MLSWSERGDPRLHGGERRHELSVPRLPDELDIGDTSAGNSHAWQSEPGSPDSSGNDYTDPDLQIVSGLPHISGGLHRT